MASEIEKNREKLNNCEKHQFVKFTNKLPRPFAMELYGICKYCGGKMPISEVYAYATGYQAAGKSHKDILPEGI